jgi:hypothetical protein
MGLRPHFAYYMKGSLNSTFAIHIGCLHSVWVVNGRARLVLSIDEGKSWLGLEALCIEFFYIRYDL